MFKHSAKGSAKKKKIKIYSQIYIWSLGEAVDQKAFLLCARDRLTRYEQYLKP